MVASLLPNGKQQFIDGNGNPLASGFVYFYVPTTSTPKNTWQNSTQSILNTNPVQLDASGEAVIYGSGQYRQLVTDSLGNTIWDQLTADVSYYAGAAGYLLNTNNLSDVSSATTSRNNLLAAPITSPTFLVGITTPLINGTAIGQTSTNLKLGNSALGSNTTGAGNTALGGNALAANTTGGTATTGNTAVGYNALPSNVSGSSNTVVGNDAAKTMTSGDDNTAMGAHALYTLAGGNNNTAIGAGCQYLSQSGEYNTAVGVNSLRENVSASHCTAVGYLALTKCTASTNTAIGDSAAKAVTSGGSNVAMGNDALLVATTAGQNTAVGVSAMSGGNGSNNCAFGYQALFAGTTATNNTAIGYTAGNGVTSGANNTLIGLGAGGASSPSGNVTTASNQVCIGDNNVTNAFIKVAWTVTSDARDKSQIEDLDVGLDYILSLRPVKYRMDDRSRYSGERDGAKADENYTIGFIAQEMARTERQLLLENDYVVDTSNPELLRITETRLLPIFVNAIKELKIELAELHSQINQLKGNKDHG